MVPYAVASRRSNHVELVSFGSPSFKSVEAGGLLVTDAIFAPNDHLCPHIHERTCVATTISGAFDSRMRGRAYWSRSAMVLTEPAGERHDNTFGSAGARVIIVQPDAARVDLLRPFTGFLDSINQLSDPRIALLARRLSREIAQPDDVTPLAVESLGLELLAVAVRRFASSVAIGKVPPWLARVRDRLHDGFADNVGLSELAALAGVHPGHLTRMFRRHFGRSIGAYQRDVRLDWTARQLSACDDPLAAIAAAADFSDQSHFTRAFRQAFGCTPGEYRTRAVGTTPAVHRR